MNLLPNNQLFKQSYFGLSINKTSLRAIAINPDKSIKSFSQVVLPPEIFDHGIIDKPALTEAIKKVLAEGNFSSNYASVTIPDVYSFTRIHTLPIIEFSEVNEAIDWQIEKIFPLPKDEIYFDWKLISQSKTKLSILIVALRRNLLDDLVQIFESLGIKPISFEPAASALARVANTTKGQPYTLLELNQIGLATTLIEDQLSTLTVTHKIDNISDTNLILQMVNQSLAELTNYYASKHKKPPTKLTGLMSGESVSQELVTWIDRSIPSTTIEMLNIPNVPSAYHQAYAGAATQILPPQSEKSINLLPTNLQHLFDASLKRKQAITILEISLALLFVAVTISTASFIFTLLRIQSANHQIMTLENQASQYSYDTKTIASLNKSSMSIVSLFPTKTTPVSYINELFNIVPQTVSIKNYIYARDKKTIVLVGTASTRAELLGLRETIKSSPMFSDARFPLESLEKPYNVEFEMTLVLADPKPIVK